MSRGGKDLPTVPIDVARGNALFERVISAIGLDDATTRWMVGSVLNTIGSKPAMLTADELGNVLPEIDRRLRQLVPGAQADGALQRLYRVLFEQAESV